mmetsp:Transcript_52816/g.136768  ORF Transcript_52816/g.136768 Transcript_52816/m.136768 type:complete len:894 (+) Transcript_52816:64-2745(+)
MPGRCGGIVVAAVAAQQSSANARANRRSEAEEYDSDDEYLPPKAADHLGSKEAIPATPQDERLKVVQLAGSICDFLNADSVQFIMYIVYVFIFQILADAVRAPTEFFFDKMIADTFIENMFDSSHNTFGSIRRVPDIWEWGDQVLIAGLLGNLGPCTSDVGAEGLLDSWGPEGPMNLTRIYAGKGCNDDVWPDGGGSFHLEGATGWTVEEVMQRMDQLDWTEGLFIRQTRAKAFPADECLLAPFTGTCYVQPGDESEVPDFGFNWTSPRDPPFAPWRYHSAAALGSAPHDFSAFMPSLAKYEGGGFAAAALPFFSNTYLPEQRGTAHDLLDFRAYAVDAGGTRQTEKFCAATPPGPTAGNASGDAPPLPASRAFDRAKGAFFCVRLTHNGEHFHQLCDPNFPVHDPLGRTTGLVRAAVEGWWNDLKRGHFIDMQTRFVQIILPFRNAEQGLRSRVKLMLETTGYGAVLPSYDMNTRVEGPSREWNLIFFSNIAFAFCVFFMILEGIEFVKDWKAYLFNVWNFMDWANFVLFFIFWSLIQDTLKFEQNRECSTFCEDFGYCDDWKVMSTNMDAKMFLSYCLCIQLLKVVKFTDTLVPKMSLATSVLAQARVELVFFTFVFVISMLAFSQLFYVQLGPVMESFNTQTGAIVSLTRSLFGDFDIDAILSNSKDYLNAIMFLAYLFVAVFILLSMFLAILGEAQGVATAAKKEKMAAGNYKEYGVIEDISAFVKKQAAVVRARARSESSTADVADSDAALAEEADDKLELLKQRDKLPARRKDLAKLQAQLTQLLRKEPEGACIGGWGEAKGASPPGHGTAASPSERRIVHLLEEALEARLLPAVLRHVDQSRLGSPQRSAAATAAAGGGVQTSRWSWACQSWAACCYACGAEHACA